MGIKINLKIFIFIAIFYLTGQINVYGILMLFAFIHELGHLVAGMLLGFKPKSMQIMPYGLSIGFSAFPKDYNMRVMHSIKITLKKLVIASAGPITNFIIATVFYFFPISLLGIQREIIIYSNILIGAFNLLPIYPLDGGRILKCMLMIFYGIRESLIHTNEITNITMILLTMISSIAIYYYKNIAMLLMILYLWALVIMQNRRFSSKMQLYKAIDREDKVLQEQVKVRNNLESILK